MQMLGIFGFAYAASLLFCAVLGVEHLVWCFSALLLLLVTGVCLRKLRVNRRFWCVAAAMVAACSCFLLYTRFVYEPACAFAGRTVSVHGSVDDTYRDTNYYRYTMTVYEVDGESVSSFGMTLFAYEDLELNVGDGISAVVTPEINHPAEGTVLSDYYKSHRLFLSADEAQELNVVPGEYTGIGSAFHWLRDALKGSLSGHMPESKAELASGMLLGDTSGFDEMEEIAFSRAGISHLFCVSGLHLTIVTQLLIGLLSILGVRRRCSAILGMAGVLGFILLAGCTPSVLRSGVMMLLLLSGELFYRKSNGLNSLGIACLFISLFNPYTMYDIGFLLSVTATLGILLFASPMERKICRIARIENERAKHTVGLFTVSLAAVIGTLPVTVLCFDEISLVGILLNPVINLFVCIAMFSGFATAFLGMVPFLSPVASFTGTICSWAVSAISNGAEAAASLPFAYLPAGLPFMKLWFLLSAVLLVFAFRARKHRLEKRLLAVAVCMVLLFVPFLLSDYVTQNFITVTAVTGGDDTAFLIRAKGKVIVYGCSSSRTETALRREMMASGIRRVDLYVQPKKGNRADLASLECAELFDVVRIAAPNGEILRGNLSAGFDGELIPLSEISLDYSDGTSLRIFGEEKPALFLLADGKLYFVGEDLQDFCEYGGQTAEFAACSQSSVSLEKVDVKHILLLFGGEEADPLDERLIGYSGANRAMVCFPQTSEPFVRMGE